METERAAGTDVTISVMANAPLVEFKDGRNKFKVTDLKQLSVYGIAFIFKMLERVYLEDGIDFMYIDAPDDLSDDKLELAAREVLAFGWKASILKWGHGRSYSARHLADSVRIIISEEGERTLEIRLVQRSAQLLYKYHQECKKQKKTCHLRDAIIWAETGGGHDDPDRNCL